MTTICAAVLALLAPFLLFDTFRRPIIRRLALRNAGRRVREASLVVGGSLLATALITASFVVGDSFDDSIRDLATTRLGPVDELVEADTIEDAANLALVIEALEAPEIDGVLPASIVELAAGSVGEGRLVEASVRLLEVPFDNTLQFGSDAGSTGLSSLDGPWAEDQVVINRELAADLDLAAGDRIELFANNESGAFEVAAVLPQKGLVGFAEILAWPGAITESFANSDDYVRPVVFVSNAGGVFEGAELTSDVAQAIEAAGGELLSGSEPVLEVKRDLLDDAEEEGQEATELFGTIGGFSVLAGILLVINLFVMLASERKTELGTMRAIGLSRGSIIRSFTLEGAIYGLIAALAGALVGVGVGASVVAYANSSALGSGAVTIGTSIQLGSLVSGAVIGLAISQVTVLLTSIGMTKVNIVRALKDLPEPKSEWRSTRIAIAGVAGLIAAGGLWTIAGDTQVGAILIPVLGVISAIPVVSALPFVAKVISRRQVGLVGCAAGLTWAAAVFGLMPEIMDNPDISVFLIQGVLLVGLGSAIVALLDGLWLRVAGALGKGGIATKLGLAYPLARPIRSVMLVAMFALVLFTVTFMAVMNAVFQAERPEMARRAGGQYDMIVDTNPSAAFDAIDFLDEAGVANAAPVRQSRVEVSLVSEGSANPEDAEAGPDDSRIQTISFVDTTFGGFADGHVQPPPAVSWADQFSSSDNAWNAVLNGTRPDNSPSSNAELWVMAPDSDDFEAGERILLSGSAGQDVSVTVAGITELGWLVGSGIYAPAALEVQLDPNERPTTRFYLRSEDGADPELVAAGLTARSPERGVDARSFADVAQEELDAQEAFLNMLQGYLGLGLLIGLAGLSIVLVRAARERRRQIGMMRAIGVSAGHVRGMFMVEAFFIGAQGVVLGIGLGTLGAWQILTKSSAFERGLGFTLPGLWLLGLAVGSLALSILAGVGPALRAGKESPAEALRFTA